MLQVAPIAIALWGTLIPGPNAVGFRSEILSDPIRQYELDRKPRPVQAATWYFPPKPPSVCQGSRPINLDIPRPIRPGRVRVRLDKVHQKYCCGGSLSEAAKRPFGWRGKTPSTAAENRRLCKEGCSYRGTAGSLSCCIATERDGTYEEDSVLFEYLASHGYVVLSTAFPCQDAAYIGDCPGPSQFRVGDRVGDLYFLLHHASTLPFVDMSRIALAGHSAGGQTSIQWAFQNSLARPVVSLDSTIEQWGLGAENFDDLRRMIEGNSRYATPTLLFAPLRPRAQEWRNRIGMDIRRSSNLG